MTPKQAFPVPAGCVAEVFDRSADEIIPGLWLGSVRAGQNKNFLQV